jgi:hypothetical protein
MSVDTIIEAVGAAATLAAVWFAKTTVDKSNDAARQFDEAQTTARREHAEALERADRARQAEQAAHLESITEQRLATLEQRNAALNEQTARTLEGVERSRAFEADLAVRRLAQVEQIADLLLKLIETADREYTAYQGGINLPPHVPAIRARLKIAVDSLIQLHGPNLRDKMPRGGSGPGVDASVTREGAIDMLLAIQNLIEQGDDRLQVEHPQDFEPATLAQNRPFRGEPRAKSELRAEVAPSNDAVPHEFVDLTHDDVAAAAPGLEDEESRPAPRDPSVG